jgi:hypothetical protein
MTTTTNSPGRGAMIDVEGVSKSFGETDWQIRWRLQPDGRTVLEVTDQAGNLTGLVASTRLPIVSVDGAWRGTRRSADGTQQRWALASRRCGAWVSASWRSLLFPTHPAGIDRLVVDGFSAAHRRAGGRLLKQAVERLALAVIERAEYLVLDC